jgi:hypothetical protein
VGLLAYLTNAKNILGNLNNDIAFLATVLAKSYLHQRFGVAFDATAKPQGAPGIDIDISTAEHGRIVGEIKTTKPYQPGFGAKQREEICKDLDRLAGTPAERRFMFVSDADTFETLCGAPFSRRASGIEVVKLTSGRTFLCPEPAVQEVTAPARHFPGPAGRNKYDPLGQYLRRQTFNEVVLTFREIEEIIGSSLPSSADRPQWWPNIQNQAQMSPQRQACWAAGYETFLIAGSRKVRFRRVK